MTKRAHGEGSIYQRKDGKWCASVRFEDTTTGDHSRATFYGRTKTEAKQKLKAAIARLDEGAPVRDASATVAAWLAEWRKTALAASSRADSTKTTYELLCKKHLEPAPFGAITLDRLRASDLDRLILSLRAAGLSDSTIRQTYTILRQALSDAKRDNLIARNVAEAVKRPTVAKKEARYLSPAEVTRLLDAAKGSRYHDLLAFIAGTGVRKGEALATKWSDLDMDTGVYHVPGTKSDSSRRTLPLPPALIAILKAHKRRQAEERIRAANVWHDTGLVFTTEAGTAVGPRNVLRALYTAAAAAGLDDVCVHTLRHSAATAWLENGVNLKAVSTLLGHADISITADTYAHVSDETARQAMTTLANVLGL